MRWCRTTRAHCLRRTFEFPMHQQYHLLVFWGKVIIKVQDLLVLIQHLSHVSQKRLLLLPHLF